MSARRSLAGVAAASLAVSALAILTSAPASADPSFVPVDSDIVGVGSDTSQFALSYLADGTTVLGTAVPGYNAGRTTGRLVSFDATGGGTVTLKQGSTPVTRPNGSGAGKNTLYGAGNNPDVDFARSSSAISSAEASAGLFAFPFALDVLRMATAKTSNAPASLSEADIVKIYSGAVTNWSQVGGTAGTIVPQIPQTGSGTRSFFVSELKRMNGGVDVVLAGSVTEVQEHEDDPIKANPNAIAPFSEGRAGLEGTLRLLTGGLDANRALYNVVRSADVGKADIKAAFGEDGWVCSPAAKPLIEAAGFEQLATPYHGGVCGEPTQAATSNFAVAYTPVAADLVGVGSDTSQFALRYLADGHGDADGYNATANAATGKLVSFDATGGGKIQLKGGSAPVTRPNGSGAGKNTLYGAGNNPDVDFARSSSAISSAEASAGLFAFPFALDVLRMATAKTSNAPASLSEADIVKIYSGAVTNWSQVGGTAGTIVPQIPQTGSGTRSFFVSELKRMNGGVDVVLAGSVTEVQEHEDDPIKANPNAIAPFSEGRAGLEGTLRLLTGGLDANRALYNVVRSADVASAKVAGVFGSTGFVCSPAARPLIEAAGFEQLATPANDGVCGEPTQVATNDFTTNDTVVTTTSASAVQSGANVVVSAAVSPAAGIDGAVRFFEVVGGENVPVGTEVPLTGGTASTTVAAPAVGAHTYLARFVPAEGSQFEASTSEPVSVTVLTVSRTALSVPTGTTYGKTRVVTATVTAGGAPATGSVTITIGGAPITVALVGGKGSVTVPATKAAGAYAVVATYAGSSTVDDSSATGSLRIAKARSTVSETFAATIRKGKKASGSVIVKLVGSTTPATGKVTVKLGKKVVGKGTLKNGKVKIKLAKLKKGKNKLTVAYAGSGSVEKATKAFTIKQK